MLLKSKVLVGRAACNFAIFVAGLSAALAFCEDKPGPEGNGNALPVWSAVHKYDLQRGTSETRQYGPANGVSERMPIDHAVHSLFGCSKLAGDLLVQEYGRYFGMRTGCFRCGCITGGNHAAPDHHHLRIEDVHETGDADTKSSPDQLKRLQSGVVTVVGQLRHQRTRELSTICLRARQSGVGALAGDPPCFARERGARGQRLEAAATRAVAGALGGFPAVFWISSRSVVSWLVRSPS